MSLWVSRGNQRDMSLIAYTSFAVEWCGMLQHLALSCSMRAKLILLYYTPEIYMRVCVCVRVYACVRVFQGWEL
jgi:predicted secreted Zn-dependent protease